MDTSHNRSPAQEPLLTPLGEQSRHCEKHGEYVSRGTKWRGGREVWGACPGCQADREEAARQELAYRAAAARSAECERAIGEAGIPARFRARSFSNFVADTEPKRHALTVARDFAEAFSDDKRGSGLIFAGLPGTGKTHLAAAVAQALISRHSVQYLTCLGLVRAVRDTWRKDSERTEKSVVRMLGEEVDLLVLDEIGATYGTDGEQTILFDVLDKRYGAMKPTLLLTNQNKEGFKGFVGERVFDRLVETSRWVPFDWPSYRAAARGAA